MRQQSETRAGAYRRTFESDGYDPELIRRAKRVKVPPDLGTSRRDVPNHDWLQVFEIELEDALLDYEELRATGRPTADLADYIDYLADCVFELHVDPKRGLATVAARRGIPST